MIASANSGQPYDQAGNRTIETKGAAIAHSVPIPVANHRRNAREEKKLRIYVGNFGFDTREQELRDAFEAHGKVQEVSMMKDRDTGRSKGFAFVEMPTSAEAQAAIGAINGKEFDGRAVTVNEARPRPERSFGGGNSGGYGNRGGGGGGRGSRW